MGDGNAERFFFYSKSLSRNDRTYEREIPFSTFDEMFDVYKQSILPLIEANKLKMILFQYPPWFDCKVKNVDLLRYTKEKMEDLPCAIEFRNQTWFYREMRDKTLQFLEKENWIHTICDEPQAGIGSITAYIRGNKLGHGVNTFSWPKCSWLAG